MFMNGSTQTKVRDTAPGEPGIRPAPQQPQWQDQETAERVTQHLAGMPALVRGRDVRALRDLVGRVARGALTVLQFGDCAEDPLADKATHTSAALRLEVELRRAAQARPGEILMVGRIGGQYAKPRSSATELIGNRELQSYRGHMVNRPGHNDRGHDAWHMMTCFAAAQEVMARLGWHAHEGPISCDSHPLWTSHEALVLDYERPLIRASRDGAYLSSTHWPWIGDRTRDPSGPHVQMLAGVINPIAVKLGPTATPEAALELCRVLDPERSAGRLTFISRMGRRNVGAHLGPILSAVADEGYPVVWMCDPMHGNTTKLDNGEKTRFVDDVVGEVHEFLATVEARGAIPGGLHLEATSEDVLECHASPRAVEDSRSTTLCDPRLNLEQAFRVVSAWNLGLDMSHRWTRNPA